MADVCVSQPAAAAPAQFPSFGAKLLSDTAPLTLRCFPPPLLSVNVRLGSPQDRVLLTGLHTVQDAFCASCDDRLGWRYVKAAVPSQRYKEGCFILEQARVYQVRACRRDGGEEFTRTP